MHFSKSEVLNGGAGFCFCQHFGLCVVSPLPLAPGALEFYSSCKAEWEGLTRWVKILNNEDN